LKEQQHISVVSIQSRNGESVPLIIILVCQLGFVAAEGVWLFSILSFVS